ncbi:ClbS/DfsB family four-helix bundle protein [Schaalia cardiffensis]|uniref:ClbS/DfsB family four-helix bundle protein n=1 Tax=Schaalia cardiffensis TaxID=181487 RepID=UPI0023F267AF|nr:ClbS/DfsB family four-helix bundle protein [Schaalia cardiffensis]
MARPTSKEDLIAASARGYGKLKEFAASMTEDELEAPFDFSADKGKTEAHWSRDKNLRDVLTHLHEWHRLLLDWVGANIAGERRPFVPEPYTWRTYGDMNVALWRRHQETSLEEAEKLLAESHNAVMALVEGFSDEDLFHKGRFDWTGTTTLGSYFVSATSSHYDWALKKLRAHRRNCRRNE